MNSGQIYKELNDINNDKTITLEERKIYLAIFGAELERQKYNEYITNQKQKLQNLRIKVIDEIMNIYPTLDEHQKEVAYGMLWELSIGASASPHNIFGGIDDVVAEHEMSNETLSGCIPIYLDNSIHEEIETLKELEKNFHKSIEKNM